MGGIQMQYAPAGYIGLWSRMRDFTRPMLTEALEARGLDAKRHLAVVQHDRVATFLLKRSPFAKDRVL